MTTINPDRVRAELQRALEEYESYTNHLSGLPDVDGNIYALMARADEVARLADDLLVITDAS